MPPKRLKYVFTSLHLSLLLLIADTFPRLPPRLLAPQNSPAFVTFLTAGFPSIAETVPLMLAMEKGGADVIEMGVPFTDPMADGKAIQETNNVSRRFFLGMGGSVAAWAEAPELQENGDERRAEVEGMSRR